MSKNLNALRFQNSEMLQLSAVGGLQEFLYEIVCHYHASQVVKL